MSTTGDSKGQQHADELPCEPDDIPVRFLTIIAGGLTLVTVILIAVAVWAFNTTRASEMEAKGYTAEQITPAEGAHE